jgi:hypothetical protein
MNASFDVTRACGQGRQLSKQEGRQEELRELIRKTEVALHDVRMPIVTRLRLLCPPGVADAALGLHAQDHVRVVLAFEKNRFHPDAHERVQETARSDLREARVSMINETRAALSLPRMRGSPRRMRIRKYRRYGLLRCPTIRVTLNRRFYISVIQTLPSNVDTRRDT